MIPTEKNPDIDSIYGGSTVFSVHEEHRCLIAPCHLLKLVEVSNALMSAIVTLVMDIYLFQVV